MGRALRRPVRKGIGMTQASDRAALRRNAQVVETLLSLKLPGRDVLPASVEHCRAELESGLVFGRTILADRDRFIVWLSAACVLRLQDRTGALSAAAMASGVAPEEIAEVFLQCGLYAGFAATECAFAAAKLPPLADPSEPAPASIEARAAAMKTMLHQDRQNDGYSNPQLDLMHALYDIVSTYGYGVIWQRDGASLRTRLVCAVAAFVCIPSAGASLQKFVRSALSHGIHGDQLAEIVIQAAPFCGFPAAFDAMRMVSDVLKPQPAAQAGGG